MKPNSKLLLMPLLALFFLFQACSDEDDDEVNREDLLKDTWEIQSNELTDYSIATNIGTFTRETVKSIFPASDVETYEMILNEASDNLLPENSNIIFNSDNTFMVNDATSANEVVSGTWVLSSDMQALNITFDDSDIESLVFNIDELTENSMTLISNINKEAIENLGEFNFEIQGVEIQDFTIEYTFEFTK